MADLTAFSTSGRFELSLITAVAAVAVALFVIQERRSPEPMISLELWGRRPIAAANGASLLSGMVMIGLTTFLPVFVQGVMGDSPLIAGFALSAMVLGWPVGATLRGALLQALRRPRRPAHRGPAGSGRRAGVRRPDRGDFPIRRRARIACRRARDGPSVERLDHPHSGDRRLVGARQRDRVVSVRAEPRQHLRGDGVRRGAQFRPPAVRRRRHFG